ncbi:MAG: molybdate ABC transporter substrate-binding protein [Shimia sp.]|uniref:molybdate ABC transporter substrate-binding protein n=1 Tax=Shimia sp. TaxID=1954381 RepID=UPI004057D390
MCSFITAVAVTVGVWIGGAGRADVNVFAAASLKTALEEIALQFEQLYESDVRLTLAGSSVLARQIALGAPADVYISANVAWMDYLVVKGRIAEGSVRPVAGNQLVLVRPVPSSGEGPPTLEDVFAGEAEGRIAMALVDAVPAGIYGKAALQSLNFWGQASDRVVQTDNVRAALALVALGEVSWGIVYASDAMAEKRAEIVHYFSSETHPEIVYPAAVIATSKSSKSLEFVQFLSGDHARRVLLENGFVLRDDKP